VAPTQPVQSEEGPPEGREGTKPKRSVGCSPKLIRAFPGLQSGEAGFQARENPSSCNDWALALVRTYLNHSWRSHRSSPPVRPRPTDG
jgi:hypothetical protein